MIQLTLVTFLPRVLAESVIFMSSKATFVACLKKQLGSVSRVMRSLVQEIVAWSDLHSVILSKKYIII